MVLIAIILYLYTNLLVTQSCLTLCDPHELQPPRFLCPWKSPGKNTGVSCHFLFQGIFLTQGWNQSLLHLLWSRQILYHQHHLGSPILRLANVKSSNSVPPFFEIILIFLIPLQLHLYFVISLFLSFKKPTWF